MVRNPIPRTLGAFALLGFGALAANAQEAAKPAYYSTAVWSPNSRSLVFESTRDGKYAIYTVDPDGAGLRKLTSGAANDEQPSWSPDGERIVFASDRDGHQQLYLMTADGGIQTRLTRTPSGQHFYPSFSPDGKSIVFGAQDAGKMNVYYVSIIRGDGTGMRRLTDTSHSSEGPHWSKDGQRIVFTQVPLLQRLPNEAPRDFVQRRTAAERTMSMRPDGGDVMSAPTDSMTERNVSPNGRWATYTKQVNGEYGVYVVDLATRKERLVAGKRGP